MTRRPIFYDTETTGVNIEQGRIVEIAAFDPVRGVTFEKLINPGMPIPKEAMAIHQITDDMVKNAPPFAEIGKQFIEFCDGDVVLIAHNNDVFDLPYMRAEMRRSGLEMPSSWLYIDTLKWARRYRKDLPRHALQYLRQLYGIKENNAHRALDDVMVLYEVYCRMVDDLSCEQVHALLKQAPQTAAITPTQIREVRQEKKAEDNLLLLNL